MNLESIEQKLNDYIKYTEKTDTDILKSIDKIEQSMTKGMDKIVARQDTANGRTSKHDKILNKIIGGLIVIGALVTGLLIPLTLNYLKSKQDVSTQVREVMGEYFEKK